MILKNNIYQSLKLLKLNLIFNKMSKKPDLTEEQRKEIAYSTLSNIETAAKYNTSKWTVEQIKKEFGTNLGRGNGIRRSGFKLTSEQKVEIAKSKEDKHILADRYGVFYSTINKIKLDAGTSNPTGGPSGTKKPFTDYEIERCKDISISVRQLSRELNRSTFLIQQNRLVLGIKSESKKGFPKKPFTYYEIERIKDVTISGRKLSIELGITEHRIYSKRVELGVNYDEWKAENPKPRSQREYKPRPKKEKVILNSRGKKELPVKLIVTKKKSESVGMRETKHEYEAKQLEKAKKVKEDYKEIERKKMAEGYKYVTRVGRFGIKETVLIKQ